MDLFVYILATITSLICAILLFIGYKRNRFSLLFWNAVGFSFIFITNLILVFDFYILTDIDLPVLRLIPTLLGQMAIIYGLVRGLI